MLVFISNVRVKMAYNIYRSCQDVIREIKALEVEILFNYNVYLSFYRLYRLIFATLYPTYRSYKEIGNEDVKEHVSKNFLFIYTFYKYGIKNKNFYVFSL